MKLYALLTVTGTAMTETVLGDDEINSQELVSSAIAYAEKDANWDKNTVFTDVSDNDYLQDIFSP